MYYTVYKTTNKLNGKIYIGVHKTNDLNDGYLGSGKLLGLAIKKYGIENFEKEILAIFDKASEMFNMESELVNEEFVERGDTYNLKQGGHGGWDHVEHTLEKRKEFSIKGGETVSNNGTLRNANKSFLLKLQTDEKYAVAFKEKVSKSVQKYYDDGGINPQKGKTLSEAHKEKIAKASSGIGNSQYGTMWIHSKTLKQSKRISKTDPIPEGWEKGRKIKFGSVK